MLNRIHPLTQHVTSPLPRISRTTPPRFPNHSVPLQQWRRQSSSSSSIDTPSASLPQPSPSSPHTSLTTFLTHARHTSLSPTSPTYLGTRYEYLTLSHLCTHLRFHLTRVGGRGDSGIDLLGLWPLPAILRAQSQPPAKPTATDKGADADATRVLVQCKRVSRAGPHLIRELEGSFRGAPSGWRGESGLGVMVCTSAATKGVREAMERSTRGLLWVMLEEEGGGEGEYEVPRTRMRQFLFNAAAAERCGLEWINVGLKYDCVGEPEEVQLLWQAKPIDFGLS